MNTTIHNADGAVHVCIVTLALMAAIAITGFAIAVRLDASNGMQPNIHASRTLKAPVQRRRPIATSLAVHRSALFRPAFSQVIIV